MVGLKLGLAASTALIAAGLWLASSGAPPPVSGSGAPIEIIPISGTVDDGMAHLVHRSIDEAQRIGARAIVLDVNSPGGVLEAALDIHDALLDTPIPTYAYLRER